MPKSRVRDVDPEEELSILQEIKRANTRFKNKGLSATERKCLLEQSVWASGEVEYVNEFIHDRTALTHSTNYILGDIKQRRKIIKDWYKRKGYVKKNPAPYGKSTIDIDPFAALEGYKKEWKKLHPKEEEYPEVPVHTKDMRNREMALHEQEHKRSVRWGNVIRQHRWSGFN